MFSFLQKILGYQTNNTSPHLKKVDQQLLPTFASYCKIQDGQITSTKETELEKKIIVWLQDIIPPPLHTWVESTIISSTDESSYTTSDEETSESSSTAFE